MLKHENTATSDLLYQTADCQTTDGEMLKHKNTATSDLLHQTVDCQTTDGEMVKHENTATSDLLRQTVDCQTTDSEMLKHQSTATSDVGTADTSDNRRSLEIQGTALGKCLRAWSCMYRSMPAGVAQSRHAFVGGTVSTWAS